MDAARWNRIEDLLQAALDREPGDRSAFLDSACSGDSELRREVDALLAHEHNTAALSQVPALAAAELQRPLLTGTRISHYLIEKRIGAGGMGEVYEARDESLQRLVALKVLPREFVDEADRVRRFEHEALAASRLNHPNIITIFEILGGEGSNFIAMEHIDGRTLRALLTDPASGKPRRLNIEKALEITIQIAAALKAAHTAWIIHRDIKPENIMVRSDGLVKVLDFGIAKLNEDSPGTTIAAAAAQRSDTNANLTVPGAILGTASYMSPEQARGEPLDGRTDLFSLGLVLNEMVTGERLPRASRLDHVPREVERIIRKLLHTERDARYSSASDLLEDLNLVKHRLESRTARRMVAIGALAVVVALAVAGIAAYLSVDETWDEHVLRDGHTAAAREAIFSPDGKTIVSCGEDRRVIVWDFARREQIASLDHPSFKVAYSPDGTWLATGGIDGSIAIWDTKRWTRLRTFGGGHSEVGALAFSPDGTILASADGSTARLWRTTDWTSIRSWPGGTSHGTFLFSGRSVLGSAGMKAIDDAGIGPDHNDDQTSTNWMAFAPDRTRFATIDSVGRVWFYRLPELGNFRRIETIDRIPGHRDHGRGIAWSPNGDLVASASEDIVLWNPVTRQKIARFEYPSIVWSVAFSPDGRWLVSSHGDGAVLIWDVRERELVASLNEHSGGVRAVAFSPDGRRVASASEDRSVAIWDVARGKKEAVLNGHLTRVMAVSFSRSTGQLASADQNSEVILWDIDRRQPRSRFGKRSYGSTYCMAISPDGQMLATTLGIWDLTSRTLIRIENQVRGQIYGNALSRDATTMATASSGGDVAIWSTRPIRVLKRVNVPRTHQIAMSMSPDGKFLATGEDEGTVRLWSVSPLRQLAVLGRHAARVKSVVFSPDGHYVASAGDDKMIALWDVARRSLHERIGTHASPIYALAFSPDGRQLASGEHDRSVRVYTRHHTLWGMQLE